VATVTGRALPLLAFLERAIRERMEVRLIFGDAIRYGFPRGLRGSVLVFKQRGDHPGFLQSIAVANIRGAEPAGNSKRSLRIHDEGRK
jgi:hypothetical protein